MNYPTCDEEGNCLYCSAPRDACWCGITHRCLDCWCTFCECKARKNKLTKTVEAIMKAEPNTSSTTAEQIARYLIKIGFIKRR